MTIRPRAVRALCEVRERLRDAAAASHAATTTAREAAGAQLSLEEQLLENHLDEATDQLAIAQNVYDLEEVAEDTGVHRLAILEANAKVAETTAATEETAAKLRERTRQLRSAEKLHERVTEYRNKLEAVNEQRNTDDLVSARVRQGGR